MSGSEKFRVFLSNELERRSRENPEYSMRNFAKDLGIGPGYLSVLLRGKQPFSFKMIKRLGHELRLPEEAYDDYLVGGLDPEAERQQLEMHSFAASSRWFFEAMLVITQLEHFKNDRDWIAEALSISRSEVDAALETMLFLDWIEEDLETGEFKVLAKKTITQVGSKTSQALKKLQADANDLSLKALQRDDVSERYHSTNTIPIDSSKIDKAKKLMRAFHKKFSDTMGKESDQYDSVYHLNLSFYRLDKKPEE